MLKDWYAAGAFLNLAKKILYSVSFPMVHQGSSLITGKYTGIILQFFTVIRDGNGGSVTLLSLTPDSVCLYPDGLHYFPADIQQK
jgi:hypothetical protein